MTDSVALSRIPYKVVQHKNVRMHHFNCFIAFIFFYLQVKISYQSVSYCTRKRPCFHAFIFFLQFQIVLNTVRMHALETLFSFFICVPNRFKYLQSACFGDIVFEMFSLVPNRFKHVRMHALETLFSFVSLQFQIISNRVRMHALGTLFSIFSMQFQIVSNTIRIHALETYCFQNVH